MKHYMIMFLLFLFQYVLAPNISEEQQYNEKTHIEIKDYINSQMTLEEEDKEDLIILKSLKMTNKFNKKERRKVREICKRQELKVEWLYKVFRIESGGNTKAVNYKKGDPLDPYERMLLGRATGIIQWIPSSAICCGTSTRQLYNMSTVEQLNYVETYIILIKKSYKIKKLSDLYLAIFIPKGIGKPDHYILGYKNKERVRRNRILDVNKDSIITVGDIKTFVSLI
jgi:hypothetical protein